MDQRRDCAERKGVGSEASNEGVGSDIGSRQSGLDQACIGAQHDI